MLRFTKGYYQVQELDEKTLAVHDLRFGTFGFGDESQYIFSFEIKQLSDSLLIRQREMDSDLSKSDFQEYIARIKGED